MGRRLPSKMIAVETALPENALTQSQVWELFNQHKTLTDAEQVFYKRFLADRAIEQRYVACDQLTDIFENDPDRLHLRYAKFAADLGSRALQKSCDAAGIRPDQLDGLIVTTCTGYLCPGLTSYISERLGLNDDILARDLIGHGCGAAVPALQWAQQCLSDPSRKYIGVVSVEICTAAISWGDEIDLILSNAIFGDGAAAAIVSDQTDLPGIEFKDFQNLLWPQYRDELRFKQKDARLCNVLSKNVPDIVGQSVAALDEKLKSPEGVQVYYAMHTGGRRILDRIAQSIDLSDEQMAYSRRALRDYGNMSSPSVLFVIKGMMDDHVFKTGNYLKMFTFGAGFTAYGALGEWT